MTDRVAAFVVTLDSDIREDDVEEILTALRMVRFVASVKPVFASFDLHIARERRDSAWRRALSELAGAGPDAPV